MINTDEFVYKDSRWQDLYVHLKKCGFMVFEPGAMVGECTSPYVVIKNEGATKHASFSTDVCLYSVMCYVPKMQYSKLEPFVCDVMDAIRQLEPLFKRQGTMSASYYDDDVKAHMISITYKNYKKL